MPITSSSFAVDPAQRDGRVRINERHIDSANGPLLFAYLAANDSNATAVMTARVAQINETLAQNEFERQITTDTPIVALVLVQNTAAQFAARLVARFHDSERFERARLCAWVLNRIDAGIYTDTQVRNAFGYSAGVWTTYKARMTTLRSEYNSIMSAVAD